MKLSILSLIIFMTVSVTVQGQATLEVTLNGIKAGKGNLRVGLFTEDNFLKTPVEGKLVKADEELVVLKFDNVREGFYAVSVIHDTNENGELDKTKLGIPREGFAFSNNTMGKKGPPAFQKAKFEVKGAGVIKQELTMRYP